MGSRAQPCRHIPHERSERGMYSRLLYIHLLCIYIGIEKNFGLLDKYILTLIFQRNGKIFLDKTLENERLYKCNKSIISFLFYLNFYLFILSHPRNPSYSTHKLLKIHQLTTRKSSINFSLLRKLVKVHFC